MGDLVFLVFFFISPVLFYVQLRLAGYRLFSVRLIPVITIALILFSYIGLFPLYFQLDSYRVATGIIDKELILIILIWSIVAIFFFLSGCIFLRYALLKPTFKINSTIISPLKKIEILFLGAGFLLSCCTLYLYLMKIDDIALFVALKQGIAESKIARSKMGNAFTGSYHWYKLLMIDLAVVISYILFASWKKKPSVLVGSFFLVSFIYCFFVLVMATEKAPFIYYLIGLFMVFLITNYNSKIPTKNIIKLTIIILISLTLFYILFMGSKDIVSALSSVVSRAFSGSIAPMYFYLEYYPYHEDFLLGKTFPNPGSLFPYVPVRYTVDVMNWKFPHLAEQGIIGSAPTVFWGEAYVNFGFLGIPIISFIMGILIYLIDYLFNRLQINSIWVGFYAWAILLFHNISFSGFSGYIINLPFFVLTFFVCVVLLSGSRGKIFLKNEHIK